jgi:hypothetical protein
MKIEAIHDLYRAWLAADERWQANLVAKYGKRAGDMRYLPEAKLVPGHDEWHAAGMAYHKALTLQVTF